MTDIRALTDEIDKAEAVARELTDRVNEAVDAADAARERVAAALVPLLSTCTATATMGEVRLSGASPELLAACAVCFGSGVRVDQGCLVVEGWQDKYCDLQLTQAPFVLRAVREYRVTEARQALAKAEADLAALVAP